MAVLKRSKIGWTDFSGGDLNFVERGRTPGDCECSPGCQGCYALAGMERWNRGPAVTTFYPEKLERLLKAKVPTGENRRGPGSRPMAFACDTGDLCHKNVTNAQICSALCVMTERKDIDWQVLTKRPGRLAELLGNTALPENIWVGTTVESQGQWRRIIDLQSVRVRVRFLSIEPMLSPVDIPYAIGLRGAHLPSQFTWVLGREIHWVIVGAESGPKRRPFDPAWARDIREQCRDAGVACFIKQDSGMFPGRPLLLDGEEVKEWPR